jgi:hypothetical protein
VSNWHNPPSCSHFRSLPSFQIAFYSYMTQAPLLVFGVCNLALFIVSMGGLFTLFLVSRHPLCMAVTQPNFHQCFRILLMLSKSSHTLYGWRCSWYWSILLSTWSYLQPCDRSIKIGVALLAWRRFLTQPRIPIHRTISSTVTSCGKMNSNSVWLVNSWWSIYM